MPKEQWNKETIAEWKKKLKETLSACKPVKYKNYAEQSLEQALSIIEHLQTVGEGKARQPDCVYQAWIGDRYFCDDPTSPNCELECPKDCKTITPYTKEVTPK